MAQRRPARPTDRIDEGMGFVMFFAVLFLVVTVFCELTGRPALGWAMTLLVTVLVLVGLLRWRVATVRRATGVRTLPARPDPDATRTGAGVRED